MLRNTVIFVAVWFHISCLFIVSQFLNLIFILKILHPRMPIRGVQYYSTQTELPISILDNTILAIDGFWYLRKYLYISTGEHFNNYSTPLKECLDPIIKMRKKVSIIWIWDGLEFRQAAPFNLDRVVATNCAKINNFGTFNKSLFDQELFVDIATSFLREHEVTVIRAPYSAAAQCSYYLRESCINYTFGKTDAILFEDCNKLITEFDFVKSTVQVFDRKAFFKSNNLNIESFRRLAFVSGCEYCPTHPYHAESFNFQELVEMVNNNTCLSSLDALNFTTEEITKFKTEYPQAFFIVEFNPVMYLDGIVRPLSTSPCPEDLDRIFGKRQSDFIYQQIFTCSIGIKILSIMMFQRNKSFYKTNLCNAYEAILNTKASEINKNEDLFDFLSKKLEIKINWESHFMKLVQLVFMSLVDCDFDSNGLIKLLNLGSLPADTIDTSQSRVIYSAENLKHFYIYNEVFILYKDLCKLAKAVFKFEQSFDFDLHFNKIATSELNSEISHFVSKNYNSAVKMKEILVLLENK